MRHPTDGVLRRLLDEPAGVPDPVRAHITGCRRCLDTLAATRTDAALVGAALTAGHGDAAGDTSADWDSDADLAWRRLSAAAEAGTRNGSSASRPGSAAAVDPRRAARSRRSIRRPLIAGVAAVALLGGATAAAATDWLQIFRTEQVAPVSLSTADLNALPDLSAFGRLSVTGDGDVHGVPDAATAAKQTGLEVPEVTDLPGGVTGEPAYQVGGQVSATFTFSADRAARAAADAGEAMPQPPPGLDGSRLRMVAGPGVAEIWSRSGEIPTLLVGRAVAPTAYSSGVPFETARDYLLSLPGLPADVAAQLRTFSADGSTLPVPIPSDYVTSSEARVGDAPATVLATRDKTLAAVVWVDNGVVTVVAGALGSDEVLAVAQEVG